MDTHYSKLKNYGFKIITMQRFGEDICWLITRPRGKKMEKFSIWLLSDNMTINVNMLGSFMKSRIESYVADNLIVTI